MSKTGLIIWELALALALAGCASPQAAGDRLRVVATTSLVGDVVRQVGGEHIELSVLLPLGADPHTFEPRPQDMAALSEAQVVFINGLALEEALEPALEANAQGRVVAVSDGIEALPFEHGGEAHSEGGQADEHAAGDPHTWTDPNNVKVWAQNIAAALAQADPANAQAYRENAEAYIARLDELDAWIREQVEQIPPAQRKLVSDHQALGYFAKAYGFEQVGLVIPALSTNAAPSAQELAALEDAIREQGVRAILVGREVNPALARQVAQDTGVSLVTLYSGSLGEAGSGAESYLDYMRYNVQAIVEALK
jgi:ABC-type Zn uptake system ZnuABC Zn-binding protein ZnuA